LFYCSVNIGLVDVSGVMVSMLTLSVVNHGFEPGQVKGQLKPMTIKLLFAASL
jgi:hypothetical protein